MYENFSDELISAYLDGELAGEDKARVEQVLMDSAEHRRLFDELRTLRESLQSLPKYELNDGFTDRVVQAAQQTEGLVAASDDDQESTVDEAPATLKFGDTGQEPQTSHPGNWRQALIAVSAVAATLILTVFLGPLPVEHRNEVAVGNVKTDADESAESALDNKRDESGSNVMLQGPGEPFEDAKRLNGLAEAPPSIDRSGDGAAPAPAAPIPAKEVDDNAGMEALSRKKQADKANALSLTPNGQPRDAGAGGDRNDGARSLARELDTAKARAAFAVPTNGAVILVDCPKEFLAARAVDFTLRRHQLEIIENQSGGPNAKNRDNRQLSSRDKFADSRIEASQTDDVQRALGEYDGDIEVLLVEGTPDQIAAAFADFQNLEGWYYQTIVNEKLKAEELLRARSNQREALSSANAERRVESADLGSPQAGASLEEKAGGGASGPGFRGGFGGAVEALDAPASPAGAKFVESPQAFERKPDAAAGKAPLNSAIPVREAAEQQEGEKYLRRAQVAPGGIAENGAKSDSAPTDEEKDAKADLAQSLDADSQLGQQAAAARIRVVFVIRAVENSADLPAAAADK